MKKYHQTYTVTEAKKALENYCAYQERCHRDVENKLTELRMIPEAKEAIILHLLEQNYLNEERFAKTFARGKFSINNWGKRRIENTLNSKGISLFNIKIGLSEIGREEYLAMLNKVAEKKLPLIKESNIFKKKSKLSTFLISKGFEPELAYNTVNNLIIS